MVLIWQLSATDLDMVEYFSTGEQLHRRNAVTRYKELERLLEHYPTTYDIQRARKHVSTMWRRLETRYQNWEADPDEEPSWRLVLYLTADLEVILKRDRGDTSGDTYG